MDMLLLHRPESKPKHNADDVVVTFFTDPAKSLQPKAISFASICDITIEPATEPRNESVWRRVRGRLLPPESHAFTLHTSEAVAQRLDVLYDEFYRDGKGGHLPLDAAHPVRIDCHSFVRHIIDGNPLPTNFCDTLPTYREEQVATRDLESGVQYVAARSFPPEPVHSMVPLDDKRFNISVFGENGTLAVATTRAVLAAYDADRIYRPEM